jgi:Xaa-Pro aminopeptidase|tara:strand:- start:990 stop:1985 length:996 start_codon:yes stop_codon:yes gene_type:complete
MRPTSPSQILRQSKTKSYLVTNPTNIEYLTGIKMSSGVLLVTSRSYNLFADGRYKEIADKKVGSIIKVHLPERMESALKKLDEMGFESEHVTVGQLRRLKRKNKSTKFVQKKGIIEHFRRQKGPDEIRKFKRSQRITEELLRRVPLALKSRPTEKQLAWKFEEWARELGADALSFEPIVSFGTHSSCPHHHATDRKLKKGHIVQIDVGSKYKGYCSDQSQVFFTSRPTGLQQKVLEAISKAKQKTIESARSGITNHKLDKIARDILSEYGFEEYFTHSLGHGVGLDIHEGISLSQHGSPTKLLPNEIITIEPGVYLPGKFGIRLEDEIIVK